MLEQKVMKVYEWNQELFDDWATQVEGCITDVRIEEARDILADMWKLTMEMKTLSIQYPEGHDMFQAKYEEMRGKIDELIRAIENANFHRWHDFHSTNYPRTQAYDYAPYPYYGQPGTEPQGDKPNSHDSPGPNYETP